MTKTEDPGHVRIDALERELRALRRIVALGALFAGVALVTAIARPADDELVARSLRIVDYAGVTRAVLEAGPSDVGLRLLDGQGTTRVQLAVNATEVVLAFHDSVGAERLVLSQGFTDQSLRFVGIDGSVAAHLHVAGSERSLTLETGLGLFVRRANDQVRLELVSGPESAPQTDH